MPEFEVTSPDGAKYRVKGPEGSTKQDAIDYIRARHVSQDMQTQAKPDYASMSAGDVAKSAVSNIPSSAANLAGNIVQPFIHPIETASNIGKIGIGVMQKLGIVSSEGEGEDFRQYADAVGKYVIERAGSVEALKRTIAEDPVGLAADISAILTGGGGLAARAGGIAGKAGEIASVAGRAADPLNVAVQGTKLIGKGVDAATGGALSKTGTLINAATGGNIAPAVAARSTISKTLGRDEMTPEQAVTAGKAMSADRPGATLADVGGENMQGLIEKIAQTPGAGRTIVRPALTVQQKEQMTRLAGDLTDLTGSKSTALKAIDATVESRSKAAVPAYKVAYEAGDRPVWSDQLELLSSAPTIKGAMKTAVRKWQDNAVLDGYGAMNPSKVDRGGLLKFGKSIPVFPNIQFWDYTKRAVRSALEEATPGTDAFRQLTRFDNQLRDALVKEVPEYGRALDAWSGPSSYIRSINDGHNITNKTLTSEELTSYFSGLSASEQEGYRLGAVFHIINQMASDPAKLADYTKYLRSPAMREKVKAIMPTPEAAAAWERRLNLDVKSSEKNLTALGGSATYRRAAQAADDAGNMIQDLALGAMTGSAHGALKTAVYGAAKKARDTLMARRDKEIARIATSPAALENLPGVLGGRVLPREKSRLLIDEKASRLGQSAFQAGRLGNMPMSQ